MGMLASRLALVKPSASMAVSQAAKTLAATGVDVIDLGLGEPDFPTPAHIIDGAFQAARDGQTLYTASLGTSELREAVARKFKTENALTYALDEIIVSNGAKQVIFNALMATLEKGDEAILPAPYFVSYPEMVKLLDGEPVIVPCRAEDGLRLTPAALEAAITPKTKWVFLNMPGNPSGAAYSREELVALGAVLAKHPHVYLLSDEIYEHILFDGRDFVSFAAACPDLKDRTLTINGVSKAYAMTGWRVGYAGGPKELIAAMAKIQSQSVTSVCSIAQAASVAALTGPQDCVTEFREAFERRRNLVVEGINRIPGLKLPPPEGAFYAFIECPGLIGRKTAEGKVLETDIGVAEWLLHTAHVAAVPGSAYGVQPFFRLSTATADSVLEEAIRRISDAVNALPAG